MTICETIEAISQLNDNKDIERMLDYIQERATAMSNALKERRWVPVEERLPETNKEVLVCNDDGKIHVALLNDEHGTEWRIKYCCYDSDIWCVDENGEIVAWYPLPAPYVKGDTNE